jgi:peptidoglycan/xylan/chitin deacetylase (PgdA/CDA1 family)
MSKLRHNQAVLAYHEVMADSDYAYCVPSEQFREQLRMLKECEAASFRTHVTFDDGERSEKEVAGPLLAEHGITATYFITPGLIGTAHKFLDWDELKGLCAAGHSVQSHGWSHKFLTNCNEAELDYELRMSKHALENRLGHAVEEISIPGGRWDARVLRACEEAGYRRVYVSEPWLAQEIFGVEVIGRFMVRKGTRLEQLEKIVRRDRATLRKMKMRSQIRNGIVSLVGDDRYHRLWCRLTGYNEFEEERQHQGAETW